MGRVDEAKRSYVSAVAQSHDVVERAFLERKLGRLCPC